jgi:uncharacterized protein
MALTIRRLRVDLDTPFDAARWNGGDAFRSALFNALSMSFPAGEQLFIDSLRRGLAALPADLPAAERAAWEAAVQGFVGQEATHRHLHARFNAQLTAQGLVNRWQDRIAQRRERELAQADVRNWVGVTAATEHLTAVFAECLLAHPRLLAGAEPRLRDLWIWHSCEEIEHRSTAFDLYRTLGGNEVWRLRLFRVVSAHFACDLARQTASNLWRSGAFFRVSTWVSAWRTLLGTGGLLRTGWPLWRRYEAADFHPAQTDGQIAARWLADHAALAPAVRELASARGHVPAPAAHPLTAAASAGSGSA